MSITSTEVREWIRAYAAEIAEHRAELVKLDTAIGDGDHGTNMNRGFKAAVQRLDGLEGDQDFGGVFKAIGMQVTVRSAPEGARKSSSLKLPSFLKRKKAS